MGSAHGSTIASPDFSPIPRSAIRLSIADYQSRASNERACRAVALFGAGLDWCGSVLLIGGVAAALSARSAR
jgi:hypothetical protein